MSPALVGGSLLLSHWGNQSVAVSVWVFVCVFVSICMSVSMQLSLHLYIISLSVDSCIHVCISPVSSVSLENLIDTMSESQSITQHYVQPRRGPGGEAWPRSGWLIRLMTVVGHEGVKGLAQERQAGNQAYSYCLTLTSLRGLTGYGAKSRTPQLTSL